MPVYVRNFSRDWRIRTRASSERDGILSDSFPICPAESSVIFWRFCIQENGVPKSVLILQKDQCQYCSKKFYFLSSGSACRRYSNIRIWVSRSALSPKRRRCSRRFSSVSSSLRLWRSSRSMGGLVSVQGQWREEESGERGECTPENFPRCFFFFFSAPYPHIIVVFSKKKRISYGALVNFPKILGENSLFYPLRNISLQILLFIFGMFLRSRSVIDASIWSVEIIPIFTFFRICCRKNRRESGIADCPGGSPRTARVFHGFFDWRSSMVSASVFCR